MKPMIITILITTALIIAYISIRKIYIRIQEENRKNSRIFLEHYSSINTKSYDELLYMHQELEALLRNRSTLLVFQYDNTLNYERHLSFERFEERKHSLKNDKISTEKQLFGCIFFSDAERLNEAIIKRLNEISNN